MVTIADIIRQSWNLYISKFKKYLWVLAAIFVVTSAFEVLDIYFIEIAKIADFWKTALLIATGLLTYFFTFIITVILVLLTNKLLDKKDASVSAQEITRVFFPALFIAILVALITIGGFLLFVVPGILFMVWYAFAMYLAVLEKKSGVKLLSESRELSRGKFWPILGRLAIPSIFWAIISYLVMTGIFNVLGLILNKGFYVSETTLVLSIISSLISNLVATFFAPLYVITTTIVYRAVRK